MEHKSDFDIAKRVGILDIETVGFDAKWDYILCACVKQVNKDNSRGPVETVSILDVKNTHGLFNDKWVVDQTTKMCDKYDLLIGWNSSRFDFPFINTRALIHKQPIPKREFRRDIMFNSRGSLRFKSNSLKNVGEGLFGVSGKKYLDWGYWVRAKQGHVASIKAIVEHCIADVAETEKVYKTMTPLFGKLRRR